MRDRSGFGQDLSQPGLELWLDGRSLGGSPFDLSLDVRTRRTYRRPAAGTSSSQGDNRVYRMLGSWHDGPFRVTLGRQFSPAISNVSIFDGVLGEYRKERWAVGIVAGTQPDAEYGVSGDVREYGAYFESGNAAGARRRWSVTTGLIGSYREGEINREFVYLQGRYDVSALSAFVAQEVDVNRGWRKAAEGTELTLTSTFAWLRWRVARRETLDAGYDDRRNPRLYLDLVTPETEFDDALALPRLSGPPGPRRILHPDGKDRAPWGIPPREPKRTTEGAMSIRLRHLVFLVLVGALAGPGLVTAKDDEHSDVPWWGATPCRHTALAMHTACLLDVREEYLIGATICQNLSLPAERRECRDAAAETRREELKSCQGQRVARLEACDVLHEVRYDPDPLLDPELEFVDVDQIPDTVPPNPWQSLEAGQVRVLSEDDGEKLVVILMTAETREFHGADCRIAVELGVEVEAAGDGEGLGAADVEYVPEELTFDYFAQTEDGDVVYCGENTVEYEDGFPASTDGTFLSGVDGAKAGFLIRAQPEVGEAHRQEFALGEAEDYIVYVSLASSPSEELGGENEAFPCDGGCLQTLDLTPLEPDHAEFKFYRPDVGFVLALGLEVNDGRLEWTGGREELACSGDSLAVLDDCGIRSPEALRETLCRVAGEYFCADGADLDRRVRRPAVARSGS